MREFRNLGSEFSLLTFISLKSCHISKGEKRSLLCPPILFFFAIFLICCLFPGFLSCSHQEKDAKITDFLVTSSAENVVVYARVINCFTKDMESAILAGVPTTFTFLVDLYQKRTHWFDKKISRLVITHTIKYDSVKKTFNVSSTNGQEPSGFQDFDSAKRAMAELNGVVVAPIRHLKKDKTYYILVKAKMEKVRLPLHMEYVFFFISLWDFETNWYKQEFVYRSG
ncbi:MAG: DUF4390 domain-containing protein [Syntrophales bacterium]|nr:DUF4390 domain-containing protein [Syntrophales bacterium]